MEQTVKALRPQVIRDFDHREMLLDRAVTKHNDTRKFMFTDRTTGEVFPKYKEDSRYKVITNSDDSELYCKTDLYAFAVEVRKVMPNVDFYLHRAEIAHGEPSVLTLAVYRPGDIFCMGVIGYAPTRVFSGRRRKWDEEEKYQYLVYSPHIVNPKYRSNSDATHMRALSGLGSAMKVVKKSLRPYSPVDVAYTCVSYFERELEKKVCAFDHKAHRLSYRLSNYTDRLVSTIQDLVSGKTTSVVDSELATLMEEYSELKQQLEAEKSKPVRSTFVLACHDGSVATLEFGSDTFAKSYSLPCTSTEVARYADANQLPEELQHAVSVIALLKEQEFVEGVGMKINDRAYWVHHAY